MTNIQLTPVAMIMTLSLLVLSCQKAPETDIEKQSYAFGAQIADGLKKRQIELDSKMVSQAVQDVLEGRELKLSQEEIQQNLLELSKKTDQLRAQDAIKNADAGKAFLEQFIKDHSAKTTPKGSAYRILKEGKGPKAKESSRVRVHYEGRLTDGKIFDSSKLRGQVAEFLVNQVIPGWSEVLTMMPVGSHWEVVIPPQLAYGETGNQLIPPHSTLIFDIEVLGIIE